MSDRDFTVGGREFKLSKLDAFKQFHIVRRMGPLLADLLPALKSAGQLKQIDGMSESEKLEQFAQFAAPFMKGLSKLSDSDADLVLFGLLSCAEMKQATGGWAKVATPSMLMIQDLELPALMTIAGRAFMFNLSGFFSALPRQT